MDPHLSVANWQPSFLDLLPTSSKPHVNVSWGILFLFTAFVNIKALSHIAVKTSQSEDKRKTAMIDDVKQTQKQAVEKRLRFVEWCDDLFAYLPQQIKMK